jgi:hypothetical protein
VHLVNSEALNSLPNLKKIVLFDDFNEVPPELASRVELRGGEPANRLFGDCPDAKELKKMPNTTSVLKVDCIGAEYWDTLLLRWRNLRTLEVRKGTNTVDLSDLPSSLEDLTLGQAPPGLSGPEGLTHLNQLLRLNLDLRPKTGGSDVPGGIDYNLSEIDAKWLPRSLVSLTLTNLILLHAEELRSFRNLKELTVDHYNVGKIRLPPSLEKLRIFTDDVSGPVDPQ